MYKIIIEIEKGYVEGEKSFALLAELIFMTRNIVHDFSAFIHRIRIVQHDRNSPGEILFTCRPLYLNFLT